MKFECEYCGRRMPIEELERRNDRLVCREIAECDHADLEREEEERAKLRKRHREGDELTEAEKEKLRGS